MFSYCPNIYTGDLPKAAVKAAIDHAMKEFPKESCGAIIKSKYVRFKNESAEPENHFEIKDSRWFDYYVDGEIRCLVHSHNDYAHASLVDQQQQQELEIPSLIINLRQQSLMDCILMGGETPPLENRPFFFGVFDCLTLVSDYFKLEHGFELPNPPHEWGFWDRKENPFEQMMETNKELPFVELSPPYDFREGDVILYNRHGMKFLNHIGVCCKEPGLIFQHYFRNLSGKYPVNHERKYLSKVMRLNK